MTRYEVRGTRTIRYELTVEADSPEEAKQIGYKAITFRSSRDLELEVQTTSRPPPFPGGLAADTGTESNV